MKCGALLFLLGAVTAVAAEPTIPNKLIDPKAFENSVVVSLADREKSRLTEEQFLAAMKEQGVVLLDARSANMYARRHVRGAVSLPFTDFTADTLAAAIPTKTTKVLIYCNNNFIGDPATFPAKNTGASLNLSTQASLRAYGYTHVFELGPLLDVRTARLPFAGTDVK